MIKKIKLRLYFYVFGPIWWTVKEWFQKEEPKEKLLVSFWIKEK